ncbi:unnamed protein product [Moneuplotes crassus]|uniref:Uncharacterized protein n=1 Tax=Euplotes crassus TaxID=5936 RepID=A0AAD1X8A7_EUPCR|nr:unnamed protein product [Moneuplotes crassus]
MFRIQIQMDKSEVVKDILYLSESRNTSLYNLPKICDNFSSATKVRKKIDAVIQQNDKLMEKKLLSKSRQIELKCKARLTEEFKDKIQNLENQNATKDIKIKEHEDITQQAIKNSEEISTEKDLLQTENKDLKDIKTQLEEDLRVKLEEIKASKSQHDEDQKEIAKIYEELKQSESELEEAKGVIQGLYKNIHSDFNPETKELKLDMSENKSRNLAKAMGVCKYSFGDMNRLEIDCIFNEDHTLNNFFKNCSQSSLRLLSLNYNFLGSNGSHALKLKFYQEGLQNLLVNVTKEVYLKNLIVNGSDLNHIVKSCVNTERLTIRYSKIYTCDSLDFSTPSQSKLEYLSFYECRGYEWCSEEWSKYSEKFEKIIVAIKKSSLKDSLKTINVRKCKISVSKLNELLIIHGLSRISAIDEQNFPLEE